MSEQETNWINELNNRVKQHRGGGLSAFDAVEQAALEFKLSMLSEGEACRVYETPDGMLINCWLDQFVEGPAKKAEPFDDQVGWYTSK